VQAVAHAAAVSGDGEGDEGEILTANVVGTWCALRAAVDAGASRFVCLSSINALGCVSGEQGALRLPLDDTHPCRPRSAYQFSKFAVEEACRAFASRYGIEALCLRPPFVSLPGDYRPDWRPDDFYVCVNEYWSYIDVRDLCAAVLSALRNPLPPEAIGGAFLVSAPDTTSGLRSLELLARHHPSISWQAADGLPAASYFADTPHRSLVDWSAAGKALDWKPRHSWRAEVAPDAGETDGAAGGMLSQPNGGACRRRIAGRAPDVPQAKPGLTTRRVRRP